LRSPVPAGRDRHRREVVALDESGKPSFNTLQNYGLSTAPVFYFDVLMLAGRDVAEESLIVRRKLLENRILSKLADHRA